MPVCRLFTRVLLAATLSFGVMGGVAHAGYKVLEHDGSANTSGSAKVLVAPSQNDFSLLIRRIRISNSASATRPDYRFFARLSADQEGDTANLGSCNLPSCIEIAAAESVQEGSPIDLDGLNIRLLPGDRLYFFATADISSESEYVTLEVWYDESTDQRPGNERRRRGR